MAKVIKVLLTLVFSVIVIIFAAGALLGAFFDPNEYKADIEQAAAEYTGIDLDINGDISWSVFPQLGLKVEDIKMGVKGKQQLAALQQANISVNLAALFTGKVKAQDLLIEGLQATLVEDQNGQTNWSFDNKGAASSSDLSKPADTAVSTENQQGKKAGGTKNPTSFSLEIASVRVVNSSVNWTKTTKNNQVQQVELTDINFETGRVEEDSVIPVALNLFIKQSNNQTTTFSSAIELTTQATFNLEKQLFTAKQLELTVKPQDPSLPNLNLNADASLNLSDNSLQLSAVQLNANDISASGQLSIADLSSMQMQGELKLLPFDLKQSLKSLNQPVPATANPQALSNISLTSSIKGNLKQIQLDNLAIQVDETKLKGTAKYNLINGRIFARLAGNQMNVSDYLPPKDEQNHTEQSKADASDNSSANAQASSSKQENSPTHNGYSKEEVIPVELLQSLNLDVALTLKNLTFDQHQAKNIDIAVTASKGLVKVSRLNLNIYAGKVTNKISIDARKRPVKIHSSKQVSGLQLGDMLTKLTGDAPITGSLNSQSNLSVSGQSVFSFVNTLNGSGKITLTDGVIKEIDMVQDMCQSLANLKSLGSVKAKNSIDKSTPFAKMTASFKAKQGVINNQDLKADLDAINANGRGSVNLPKSLIDYRLGLIIQENLFKKTCSVNNKLEGIEWPVDCKGSFDTPPAKLCRPDTSVIKDILKKAIKDKYKAKADKKIEEKKAELKEKLQDKIQKEVGKKLLKGLFN